MSIDLAVLARLEDEKEKIDKERQQKKKDV